MAALRLTHLELKNWRNFKHFAMPLQSRQLIVGPNASGKSNLLDAIRFLRDLVLTGGGLQQAVHRRGGLSRLRSLAARNFNKGRVELAVSLGDDSDSEQWSYRLCFSAERSGRKRPIVILEEVHQGKRRVLLRPNSADESDEERLTQTALEQVNLNHEFRQVAEFFASVRYLHLVPQVIREPARGSSHDDDPFGGDFLARIARTPAKTRDKRLRQVNDALRLAVPQLDELALVKDVEGRPHLEARYQHWRVEGARQDEADFSDGTLRLIGLLWSLLESGRTAGPVLLEEPELSLHAAVVRQLPTLLARAHSRSGRQVLVSTHADEILADPGLGLDEVIVLSPGNEGTCATSAQSIDGVKGLLESGMTLAEVLRPLTAPNQAARLGAVNL